MSNFWDFIEKLRQLLLWWVVVTPWEQAMRVRTIPWRRQRVKKLPPGIHLKLPMVDQVYKQSVRLRTVSLPIQTLTTQDDQTLTLSGVFGYSISDLQLLYDTLHHAEDTIRNKAQSSIAQYVQSNPKVSCTPERVALNACRGLDLKKFGLDCGELELVDFAYVRTHRFITDTKWGNYGDVLNTTHQVTDSDP